MKSIYGERIKEIRKRLGISQLDMANQLNLTIQTISRYECDKMIPSADTLTLIVNVFNVRAEWLLTGSGDMFHSKNNETTTDEVLDKINSLITGMSDDQKKDILKIIEKEKLLADLLNRDKNRGYC